VLFGVLIASGKRVELAIGYLIGAILMIAAGLVEVWLGVNAEQKLLEEIAPADRRGRRPALRDHRRRGHRACGKTRAAPPAPPGRAGAHPAGALPALVDLTPGH
jgi:hypothetical protein